MLIYQRVISLTSSTLQGTSSATSPPRSARRWPRWPSWSLWPRRWWRSWRRSRRSRCAWCRGAAGRTCWWSYPSDGTMGRSELDFPMVLFLHEDILSEIVGMESGKMWGYWQTWVNTIYMYIYIYTLYMHMYVCIYIYNYMCVYTYICADTYITLFCIALHYIASHPVTAH